MSINEQLYCLKTRNGRFANDKANNVPAIFAELDKPENADRPLLVWFHGGLVSASVGDDLVRRLTPTYLDKGLYPVFFVWDSGPVKEILDAVVALIRRKLTTGALDILTKYLETKLGYPVDPAKGFIETDRYDLSPDEEEILLEAVAAHPDLQAEAAWIAGGQEHRDRVGLAAIAGGATASDRLVEEKLYAYFEAERTQYDQQPGITGFTITGILGSIIGKFVLDLARNTLGRFRSHRDHGVMQTIIEEAVRLIELGKGAWDQMKEDIGEAFEDEPLAGGRAFIEGLKASLKTQPDRRILLVGHSAGALYVAKFLEACSLAGITQTFDIRLLAPATRYDLAKEVFDHHKDIVKSVRVFCMKEQLEHGESLLRNVPLVGSTPLLRDIYKGSLLYLVAGALEKEPDCPLLGMERYSEPREWMSDLEKSNLLAVKAEMADRAFVWSITDDLAPDGFRSKSVTHSGFSDDPDTLYSLIL